MKEYKIVCTGYRVYTFCIKAESKRAAYRKALAVLDKIDPNDEGKINDIQIEFNFSPIEPIVCKEWDW